MVVAAADGRVLMQPYALHALPPKSSLAHISASFLGNTFAVSSAAAHTTVLYNIEPRSLKAQSESYVAQRVGLYAEVLHSIPSSLGEGIRCEIQESGRWTPHMHELFSR
eukprot:TRINITY_DN1939_c0_g1_i1.p2 TRINITY_DN1939_c0_g1~~TRINITY_DN1939_c0_g1_i1.p2  ORF type:complete len:127 (+),score=36.39 TRINITY_DN1939_c0_g1_i1:55-381(+)